ncbi:YceI family protein [Rurimicrobium arvi]|uniref:Lipid/polyisoprenoid-binding YceI-like domain-containing protein n=1 Tax=Rurimicrobium arvi TaxID=2049916 RepID=A0ABP8MU91_9BACT
MKKTLLTFAAAGMLLASCQDAPKADNAATGEAQAVPMADSNVNAAYMVDLGESRVEFVGTKPVGKHHGIIGVKEGSVSVDADMIKSGKIVMDLNTLRTDDQDSTGNAKLTGHLMSPDFFDVAKYPTADFEITSVTAGVDTSVKDLVMKDATHTITGNLTMKGVSKSVSFPAKVMMSAGQVTADANFNIDRTQWGLSYGNDKSLKDKFISPTVNIQMHVVAKK